MATYNGSQYVEEQLCSIANQTRRPNELLISDDSSSDDTFEVVKHWVAENDELNAMTVSNEYNLGYKANFYALLSKAAGDYIFLADQDDVWLPGKINTMVGIMEGNPKILALNSSVILIDASGRKVRVRPLSGWRNNNFVYSNCDLPQLASFDVSYIAKHNVGPGCAMCVRKTLLSDFLNTYDFGMPHDWALNLLAANKGGCYYYDRSTVLYRVHDDNVIGANVGLKKAVRTRGRGQRLNEMQQRLHFLDLLPKEHDDYGRRAVIDFFNKAIAFYEKPSPVTFRPYCTDSIYKEAVRKKARLWDCAIAIGADALLSKALSL